ncbi:MAG: 5-(carboxyamino)imidazole ribonucleotide synthase [Ferruginibacter sp.]
MIKAGILGGGQLGRMLLQAAINYPVETYLMENDVNCPAAHLCHHFIKGDITNYDDVYNFGKQIDVLTIEIENVNTDAIRALEEEGIIIYPNSTALKTIKNKILQKQFYSEHEIPTSPFNITQNRADLSTHTPFVPSVHKLAMGGYDGKGVIVFKNEADFIHGFNAPAILEKAVDIKSELAVMIGVNKKGEMAIYPPVDMVFDPVLNLLIHQVSPADIAENVFWKAEAIALKVVKHLKSPGLFIVELFADREGNVLVNETAPRVHNSGHHTIESNYSSQFDMMWRIMLDYPLGNTEQIMPSALVNIIGAAGYEGEPHYEGLNEVLEMDNVFVHIYGKKLTKPGRKMGHVTILSNEKQELLHKASQIRQLLVVKT